MKTMFKLMALIGLITVVTLTVMDHPPHLRGAFILPEDEVTQLASLINSECSNCSETEMYLVGSVVMNRMCGPDWPNNLNSVIEQENQFYGRSTKQFHPTPQTIEIANNLLQGLYIVPEITYFCGKDVKTKPMDTILIEGQYHIYGK